jgi:hypothetical protein
MPRYTQNLLAALLTFVLGVFVTTFSRRVLPELTHLTILFGATDRPCNQLREVACNEWEKTGSVIHGVGWDLAYTSLLRNNGVCPGDFYCEIATIKPQPPVHKHFAEWKGQPIISSILIELPGHACMVAWWLIRTKDEAYFWEFDPDDRTPRGIQPVPAQDYDRVFETMTCWQQDQPLHRKFFDGRGDAGGYIGFLSLFKEGRSRQMLLTDRDLRLYRPKDDNYFDESSWGRLWKTLKPINSVISEQPKEAARIPNKPAD